MNGKTLADLYKNQLSGYRDWEGMKRLEGSSCCYIVFPENCGKYLSIDETALSRDQVFTFVTNKAGHGGKGETICGYESSWLIEDAFLDDLRAHDWNGAFEDFQTACDKQLTKLESGESVAEGADIITGPDGLEYHSYNNPYAERERSVLLRVLAVIFIPAAVALAVCSTFKAQMKTAHEASRADEYLVPHSMKLRVKDDRFTHRTESRTVIETDSSHRVSGGGGSSFHSGGGFSGRSGSF